MDSYYSKKELINIGFNALGENVLISKKSSIYSPELIRIGNNVRIDDFCILSGDVNIGNNIHISSYCALYGGGKIIMDDYSGLSPRCTIFSMIDDFDGEYLIGPHLNKIYTNVKSGKVILNRFVQLGSNTIVFPNVEVGTGSVTGALSLLNKSIGEWGVYIGQPVRFLKNRSNKLLNLLNE